LGANFALDSKRFLRPPRGQEIPSSGGKAQPDQLGLHGLEVGVRFRPSPLGLDVDARVLRFQPPVGGRICGTFDAESVDNVVEVSDEDTGFGRNVGLDVVHEATISLRDVTLHLISLKGAKHFCLAGLRRTQIERHLAARDVDALVGAGTEGSDDVQPGARRARDEPATTLVRHD
jgi:hypothetical protein